MSIKKILAGTSIAGLVIGLLLGGLSLVPVSAHDVKPVASSSQATLSSEDDDHNGVAQETEEQEPEELDELESTAAPASITPEQAQAAVLAQYPGAIVTGVELENEHGSLVYEVGLKTADGKYLEVTVDAQTGKVLPVSADDSENDAAGEQESPEAGED